MSLGAGALEVGGAGPTDLTWGSPWQPQGLNKVLLVVRDK